MYYTTDGDSGYYNIRLFQFETEAKKYLKFKSDAYSNLTTIVVNKGIEEMKYEETLCPNCKGQMVSRTGTYGVFWGCKNFPECKGTRDSQGRSKEDRAREKGEDYEKDDKDETNKFSFKRTR